VQTTLFVCRLTSQIENLHARAADGLAAAACSLLFPGALDGGANLLCIFIGKRAQHLHEKNTSASIKGAKRSRGEPAQQSIDLLEREQVA
jgi:hypothetical protein